jgi:GT2 family glycosyltransferase
LNNDTIVDKEFLSELVNTAESKENIGIVGAVNYYYHNPKKIWYSGAVINWTICKIKDITKDQIDNGQFNKIREVDDVPGSSLLIKLEVIKKIGLLFSEYYCNFEETEWCVKAKKNGYTIYANLNSKIWHKVSQSTKEIPEFQIYYMTRNRFIFMYRNASRLHFISFLTYYLSINFILTNVYFVASKKKFKLLKTYYNAIYDGIILVRKRGLLLKK